MNNNTQVLCRSQHQPLPLTKPLFVFLSIAGLFGCRNNGFHEIPPPATEAQYKMTIALNWKSPQLTVPAGAHFSDFVGMIHAADTALWMEGHYASAGLENVAEIGRNDEILREMDGIIAAGKAFSSFNMYAPLITGMRDTTLKFTLQYPAISLASMIAPSPDWFVGIQNANLLVNHQWVDRLVVKLLIYDAGTEDGDVFDYSNPASNPQQKIQLLTPATGSVIANGNASIAPVGEIIFTKL